MNRERILRRAMCPKCQEPLETLKLCRSCGTRYAADGGTPVLIANDQSCRLEIDFETRRAVRGDRFARRFRYPEARGASDVGPYHLDQAHLDVLERVARDSEGRPVSVLEIGCGGGQMRTFLEDRGYEYVGIDISKTRVTDELRTHGGPDVLCDSHFLPFTDSSFDVVYSAAVTEHLACPQ